MVIKEKTDHKDYLGLPLIQEPQVFLDPQVKLVLPVLQDQPVPLDIQVPQVKLVLPVLQDQPVPLDIQVPRDHKVHKDFREVQQTQGLLDLLEIPDLQVLLVLV
jgi:hypothetical protein